jgi:hypothetical protein
MPQNCPGVKAISLIYVRMYVHLCMCASVYVCIYLFIGTNW